VSNRFQVCIFEDAQAAQMTPYQVSRPCYTIPSGFYNLVDRMAWVFPDAPVHLICQPHHALLLKKRYPKVSVNDFNKSLPTLFINGRCNAETPIIRELMSSINPQKNRLYIHDESVIALYCQDELSSIVFNALTECPGFDDIIRIARHKSMVEDIKNVPMVAHWWDYISQLQHALTRDFESFPKKSLIEGDISSFTTLINDQGMYIDQNSHVREYVSLDATNGPIVIMGNVTIQPFVHIEGPCVIGQNSTVFSYAHISASAIGSYCKIGGEVTRSIVQSYSNKSHAGYLGDSMVGEWVNLGAQTTVSNLKLSYGTINSHSFNQVLMPTDHQFLGAIFGDHVKTGIQSTFSCGSVVSSGSSLHGTGIHATFIPPFSWGSPNNYSRQDMPAFIESVQRMMQRRGLALSDEEQLAFKELHHLTRPNDALVKTPLEN
jgi:UDP-N-acetylglucosamine diphosphorylase/glucosamine-1-phosphate N-acetyltransferase